MVGTSLDKEFSEFVKYESTLREPSLKRFRTRDPVQGGTRPHRVPVRKFAASYASNHGGSDLELERVRALGVLSRPGRVLDGSSGERLDVLDGRRPVDASREARHIFEVCPEGSHSALSFDRIPITRHRAPLKI